MASFTRKIVLFVGGIAVCMVAISIYFELRVRQQDDFYRQVAAFAQPDVQPRVLLVGDSRMAVNVMPSRLPPDVYNFSYPGETLRHLYLRIKYALETKPSIEYLVLGLEDVLFSDARAVLREATRQTAFADLVDLTDVYPANPYFLLRHAVLHYFPMVNANQRNRALNALLDDLKPLIGIPQAEATVDYSCGGLHFVRTGKWAQLDHEHRREVAQSEVEHLMKGSAFNPEMNEVLHRILALAEHHGVRVIGVRSPLSGAYLEAAYQYYEESLLSFVNTKQLHGMLDYEAIFADRPELFYNSDHLDSEGALVFTDHLVSDLTQRLPLRRNRPRQCETDEDGVRPVWPYNDVVTRWLTTPACHNLDGSCGSTTVHRRKGGRVEQEEVARNAPPTQPATKPGAGSR